MFNVIRVMLLIFANLNVKIKFCIGPGGFLCCSSRTLQIWGCRNTSNCNILLPFMQLCLVVDNMTWEKADGFAVQKSGIH